MNDWQRLGLAGPTDDLIAIKRAYASRLRSTRPDDDPAAYQALREAYDRIQRQVRLRQQRTEQVCAAHPPARQSWPTEAAAMEPVDEPVSAAATDSMPNEPASATPTVEPELIDASPTPEALCRRLLELHEQSRQALASFLPTLDRQLHDLPLSQEAEASICFAELVLRTSSLPAEVQVMLQGHFGWLDDFRSVRVLGAERAAALHEALDGLGRRVTDPATLRKHADALAIHALFGKGRSLRALLIVSLMGVHLHRQLESAGGSLLRRMGIGIDSQKRFLDLFGQGLWVRTAAMTALIFLFGWGLTRSAAGAMKGTVGAAAVAFAGVFVLQVVVNLLYLGRRIALPTRWVMRWRLYRLDRWWPWVGIGLLAVATGGVQLGPVSDGGVWGVALLILALLGLQLAVPAAVDQGFVAISLWGYAAAVLHLFDKPRWWLPLTVWILAGMHANLQRVLPAGKVFEGAWFARPPAAIGGLALCTIGLPALLSWMAQRAGYRLVLSSLLLAFSPALMRHDLPPVVALWVAPGLALGVLVSIQKGALRLARHLAAAQGTQSAR
jgi:hypothetical protein